MAIIQNVQMLHAAVAIAAPIIGVSGDGTIWFAPDATPAQQAAAHAAMAAFVDTPPPAGPQYPRQPPPTPKAVTDP